jgi:hypothetical protein
MSRAQHSATHVAPYTADGYGGREVPTDPAYAVSTRPSGYAPYEGWAPTLAETLDETRTGAAIRHDRRANLRDPWGWWKRQDADTAKRHSVESVDADGWTENKGSPRTAAPDPRSLHWPETRRTQSMAPRTYLFERPFDQEIARNFSGAHMSLAVNRRNYEILTMEPVAPRRNTYRVEPTPWDTDIVDETPNPNEGHPHSRLLVPNLSPAVTNRAYRL